MTTVQYQQYRENKWLPKHKGNAIKLKNIGTTTYQKDIQTVSCLTHMLHLTP